MAGHRRLNPLPIWGRRPTHLKGAAGARARLPQQAGVRWLPAPPASNDSSSAVEGPGFACDDPDSTALCRFVLNLPAFVDALRQGRG